MAGAMRKAMVYLGLVEDEDRYDYDDYDEMTGTDGEAATVCQRLPLPRAAS